MKQKYILLLFFLVYSLFTQASNYYWIGGTGNWDDLAHWATTSGGSTLHTQIPTALDDVFFDANSFTGMGQSITINANPVVCNNMDWTGALYNPAMAGVSTNILKIYGSLTFIYNMTIPFAGNINFESSTLGKTITTNGRTLGNDIYFMGSGGGWTLQDSLTLINSKSIYLNYGSLNTNGKNVYTYRFVSTQTNPRTLTFGSTVMNISYPYGYSACIIYTQNLTFNAGTSLIRLSGGSGVSSGGIYVYDGYTAQTASLYDVEFLYSAGTAELNGAGTINLLCHNVTFNGSGTISGNITYNDLNFTAGQNYIMQSAKTQTIIDHWRIQGTCTSYIMLQSSTNGAFATVTKAAGAVIGFNIHIRDIHCVGGASFEAYNSVDLGGNTGWNFSTLPVLSNPLGINGPTNLCVGQSGVIYFVPNVSGAINYTWTVPSGIIITSGQGDSSITITTPGGITGTITVTAFNGCGYSAPSVLTLVNCLLPIEYLSFTATRKDDDVQIDWSTASETNNDYFNIERSKDGLSFENIGKVAGAGNSNFNIYYVFTDKNPHQGISYYRIKQVDYDGQTSYSEIRAVNLNNQNEIILYPNPASDYLNICNVSDVEKDFILSIKNFQGEEVVCKAIHFSSSYKLDVSKLSKGIYVLSLRNNEENILNKIVVQ